MYTGKTLPKESMRLHDNSRKKRAFATHTRMHTHTHTHTHTQYYEINIPCFKIFISQGTYNVSKFL